MEILHLALTSFLVIGYLTGAIDSVISTTGKSSDQIITYGQSDVIGSKKVILNCSFSSNVTVDATWTRKSVSTIKESHSILTSSNMTWLTLPSVNASDNDQYNCILKDVNGTFSVSSSVNLTVFIYPHVTVSNANQTARVNNQVVLDCKVVGYPAPVVTWTRNGSVTSGIKNNNNNSLVINNVSKTDAGLYLCSANNSVGESSSSILLIVHLISDPPEIMSNIPNNTQLNLAVGSSFVYLCGATSSPPSSLFIGTANNSTIIHVTGKLANLTINSIQREDEALYMCWASNAIWSSYIRVNVTVLYKPEITMTPAANNQYNVSLGSSFTISCIGIGNPIPYVQIAKNGRATVWDQKVLQLNSTSLTDGGNYSCTASNSIGNATSTIVLVVTTVPSAPRKLRLVSKTAFSIEVEWDAPIFDGNNGDIESYTVSYSSISALVGSKTLTCPGQCGVLRTNFTGTLQAFTNYTFAVIARNADGASKNSNTLVVATDETVPSRLTMINVTFTPASRSIHVQLEPPSQPNGIIAFLLFVTVLSPIAESEVLFYNGSNPIIIYPSTLPFRQYQFRAAAYNVRLGSIGESLQSNVITTPQAAPSMPLMVNITNATAQPAFLVSWQPPSQTNGNITGYIVSLLQITNGSQQLTKSIETKFNAINTSLLVESLSFFSVYIVSVAGKTSAGTGSPSSNISALTIVGIPTAIRDLQVTDSGTDFISLSWNPPENLFSDGVTYEVNQTFDGVTTSVSCSSNIPTSCRIGQLKTFSEYEFSVSARSSKGSGLPRSITNSTKSGPPPTPSPFDSTDVFDVSTNTFTLKLQEVSNENGMISYYQVIVIQLESNNLPTTAPKDILVSNLLDYDSNKLRASPFNHYIAAEFDATDFTANNPFVVGNGVRNNRTRIVRRSAQEFYNAPLLSGTAFTAYQIAYVSSGIYSASGWFPSIQTATPIPPDDGIGLGTIVAIIIGVVLLILILALVFYCLWKHKTNQAKSDNVDGTVDRKQRKATVKRDPRVPIAADRFEEHVNQLKANGHFGFSQEYLMISRELINPYNIALKPENNPKNRYANVPAYDHSRVILANALEGDYINANYIEGLEKDQEYIATQGPLPEYIHDFWTMIWEQNVATIVMLTRLEEKNRVKCAQYWSDNGAAIYKDITVTPMERNDFPDITMRTFHVTKTGQSSERNVKQYHFTAWPDFGVPKDTSAILSLIKRVNSWNPFNAGPIVVHCSAGVGRTGTYIAIDTNIKRIEKQEDISVFMNVCSVRDQRCLMVQTEDQYIFIHNALLEYIESGQTEVAAESLRDYIKQQSQTDPQTAVTGLMQEFLRLAKTNPENKYAEANKLCNQSKNRYKNVYPYDETRVRLVQKPGLDGSDFINANYIDGYAGKNSFIATQAPLESTVADFWRMMWEQHSLTVVMLSKENESGKLKVIPYWPENEALKIDQFLIELVSTNKHGDYLIRDLKVTNAMEGSSRVVRQYQYIAWPENGSPDSGSGMIDLIGQVQKWNSSVGNRIVTVHCSAGVGKTGVFIALTNLIERLKMESLIDVYHAVKKMRQQRTAMVQTRDQYEFCYTALQEYLDSFDVIGNYK